MKFIVLAIAALTTGVALSGCLDPLPTAKASECVTHESMTRAPVPGVGYGYGAPRETGVGSGLTLCGSEALCDQTKAIAMVVVEEDGQRNVLVGDGFSFSNGTDTGDVNGVGSHTKACVSITEACASLTVEEKLRTPIGNRNTNLSSVC